MIEIVKNPVEMQELKNIELENGELYSKITLSDNLFHDARKVFDSKDKENFFSAVNVIDADGNTMFYLKNTSDIFYYAGKYTKHVKVNHDGRNLLEYIDCVDYSIIEEFDTYIFSEINEYTYEITRLINHVYPKRKVIITDKYAEIFSNINALVLENYIDINRYLTGKVMYCSLEPRGQALNYIPNEIITSYSWIKVIANLCWAINRTSYGTQYSDKTFVVIDYDPILKMGGMGGINAIISDVTFYAAKVISKGWIPVVHLTNTQYMSNEVENSWDCYFSQFSNYKYEDIQHAANVIEGKDNHFTWTPQILLLDKNLQNLQNLQVQLSDAMKNYIEKQMPDMFRVNGRILGVIARGSDLKKATGSQFTIEEFIRKVKNIYLDNNFDYIFLATEEQNYFENFKNEFGDKLLYVKQKRINYDYASRPYKLVAELLEIEDENRTEFGRKYLMITYLLSQCTALISTISCGATALAERWKTEPYEFDLVFHDIDMIQQPSEHRLLLERQRKVKEFIQNKECVIIYSIGRETRMYIPDDEDISGKIIYCDMTTNTTEVYFRDKKVLSLMEVVKGVKNVPIVVSDERYWNEIRKKIVGIGYGEKNIYKLSTLFQDNIN